MKTLYQTRATAKGGRQGQVSTDEGNLTLQLAEGGFGLTVQLSAKLEGLARDAAQQLLETTHRVCPYSNAIRGNVPVTLVLE
ncbi:MAG: hypothetical protein LRY38_00990 [Aeromonadaceae bacterium]|nr:hypothetical protein [Aeromonadaceae bacterium]